MRRWCADDRLATGGRPEVRRRRGARGAGLASVVLLLLAGTAWASQTHDVEVLDDAFSPGTVTITSGDTVRWTQSGSNPHTVTADDGSWDSHEGCQTFADAGDGECMEQGESYEQTFDEPGEYGYFCRIHGSAGAGMAGTVIVEAAAEPDEPQDDAPTEDAPVDGEPDETDETAGAEALPETGAGLATLVLVGLLAVLGGALYLRRREA